jgi:hypothetical protein
MEEKGVPVGGEELQPLHDTESVSQSEVHTEQPQPAMTDDRTDTTQIDKVKYKCQNVTRNLPLAT